MHCPFAIVCVVSLCLAFSLVDLVSSAGNGSGHCTPMSVKSTKGHIVKTGKCCVVWDEPSGTSHHRGPEENAEDIIGVRVLIDTPRGCPKGYVLDDVHKECVLEFT